MNRRRGGEMLGSQNAHKGGYYGRNFKPDETQDLEAASGGLSDEVALLRVMIRRVVELATGGGSSGDLEKAIAALNTLGTAATRLANLLKTEKKLAAGDSEMSKALNKALDDVLAELRGNKP